MEVKYLPCPVCAERMNRRQFVPGSGVIIDECRDHGIWLDAGEHHRILDFVRTHGMPAKSGQSTHSVNVALASVSGTGQAAEQVLGANGGWAVAEVLFEIAEIICCLF